MVSVIIASSNLSALLLIPSSNWLMHRLMIMLYLHPFSCNIFIKSLVKWAGWILTMINKGLITGISSILSTKVLKKCITCIQGKAKAILIKSSSHLPKFIDFLGRIHTNLCGLIKAILRECKYFASSLMTVMILCRSSICVPRTNFMKIILLGKMLLLLNIIGKLVFFIPIIGENLSAKS